MWLHSELQPPPPCLSLLPWICPLISAMIFRSHAFWRDLVNRLPQGRHSLLIEFNFCKPHGGRFLSYPCFAMRKLRLREAKGLSRITKLW